MTIAAYAASPLLIMLLALAIPFFILLACVVTIFCFAARLQAVGSSRVIALMAALFIVIMQALMTCALAVIAGFGIYPQALGFLFAAFLWVPTLMIVMSLTSSAWRTTMLVAKMCRRGGGPEDGGRNGPVASIVSLCRASFAAAMKRPLVFMIATFLALGTTLAINLGLSQVCYCTNPTSLTTWTSRRSETHYCLPNTFCHLYVVPGETSSTMRIVGHIVSDTTANRPTSSRATFCQSSQENPTTCISGITPTSLGSKLLDHAHISEDYRYLSHTVLTNLTGETYYTIEVFFDGPHSTSRSLSFQTPPDPTSTTTVKLISGGDIHQGPKFTELLKAAMLAEPNPHVIMLGGDLSYANNMRTCYLRWDEFLYDMSAVRTSVGAAVPVLTIPGNHESGGYLRWSKRSDYYFYTQYFPQYDDDQVTVAPTATSGVEEVQDSTITYHRHRFGNRLGIIALDSGLMISITDQSAYLRTTLEAMHSVSTPGDSRFVTVLQHNPMFPAHRALSAGPTEEMRAEWMPIFDTYRVPLVLEFHDHSYKRTWPLNNAQTTTQGGGTVYVGDGALGVFSDRLPDKTRSYLRTTFAGNYVNVLHCLANGTMEARTLGSSGANIDSFSVSTRWS